MSLLAQINVQSSGNVFKVHNQEATVRFIACHDQISRTKPAIWSWKIWSARPPTDKVVVLRSIWARNQNLTCSRHNRGGCRRWCLPAIDGRKVVLDLPVRDCKTRGWWDGNTWEGQGSVYNKEMDERRWPRVDVRKKKTLIVFNNFFYAFD